MLSTRGEQRPILHREFRHSALIDRSTLTMLAHFWFLVSLKIIWGADHVASGPPFWGIRSLSRCELQADFLCTFKRLIRRTTFLFDFVCRAQSTNKRLHYTPKERFCDVPRPDLFERLTLKKYFTCNATYHPLGVSAVWKMARWLTAASQNCLLLMIHSRCSFTSKSMLYHPDSY